MIKLFGKLNVHFFCLDTMHKKILNINKKNYITEIYAAFLGADWNLKICK